jgi:hypothetical protein
LERLDLKPTHAAVKNYYAVLGQFGQLHIDPNLPEFVIESSEAAKA